MLQAGDSMNHLQLICTACWIQYEYLQLIYIVKAACLSLQEANMQLQCERWRHLQWRFLNCRLEDAIVAAKPKVSSRISVVGFGVGGAQEGGKGGGFRIIGKTKVCTQDLCNWGRDVVGGGGAAKPRVCGQDLCSKHGAWG